MSVLAVIPARAGSKRLPGKNLLELGGRPLIAYSILVAHACEEIDNIVVATDSTSVRYVARDYNCPVVDLVPKLTTDTSPIVDAVREALMDTYFDDWVVTFQPNVPLRDPVLIDKAIRETIAFKADSCLSVDARTLKVGHLDGPWFHPHYVPGTLKQDIETLYREDGVFYMTEAELIMEGHIMGKRIHPVLFPQEQSLSNIDYQFDFDLTKAMFDSFGYARRFQEIEEAFFPDRSLSTVVPATDRR